MPDHPPPIIIVGAARSGTKFLRGLIDGMAGFKAVPYDVNYIWRLGNDSLPHDELDPASINDRQRDVIRSNLYRIAGIGDTNNGSVLVEKTVSNGLRLPFVDSVFPEARYLHIVRDGRAVIESSHRLWLAPPDKVSIVRKLRELPLSRVGYVFWFARNYLSGRLRGRSGGQVWGPRYSGILEEMETLPLIRVVARQWARTVSKAEEFLETVPDGRKLTIKYEELLSNPATKDELCSFIGIMDTAMFSNRFDEMVEQGNNEKWRQSLGSEDIRIIDEEAGPLLKRLGYMKDAS